MSTLFTPLDSFRDLLSLALLLLFFDFAFENYGAILDVDFDGAAFHDLVRSQFLTDGVDQKIVGNGFACCRSRGEEQ